MNSFQSLLLEIGQNLRQAEFSQIKSACKFIPAGRAEFITQPHELFSEMERQNRLSENNTDLLANLLDQIDRNDLKNKLVGTEASQEKVTTTIINEVKLAEKISTDWKSVGCYLGLENHTIRNIEDTYKRTKDKSSEMLSKWRQISSSPTVSVLIAALKNAGRTDLAEQVQERASQEKDIAASKNARQTDQAEQVQVPLTDRASQERIITTIINEMKLPEKISIDWRFVGHYLGLEDHILRNIQEDYRTTKDKSSEMLSSWRQSKTCPIVWDLIAALKNAERTDLAEEVQVMAERATQDIAASKNAGKDVADLAEQLQGYTMAPAILPSENLQTQIVKQISPDEVENKKTNKEIIGETCNAVCALLNSQQGGNFKLSSAETLTPNLLDKLVRSIEQSLIEVIGLTNLRQLCQITVLEKEIIFTIKSSDQLFTVNYSLYLPTKYLVRKVLPLEPLVNIARLLKSGLLIKSNLQNFVKVFQKDNVLCDLRESDTVQFKKLKSDPNKNKTLANRIISNGITRYISAFANHKGGHVYIGIDDETHKVCGQNVDDKEKQTIVKTVDSAIENMVWPEEHGKPELGKHWNISFIPVSVVGESMEEIPGLFVIVISIAQCPGGVFLAQPETYVIDDNKVVKMKFEEWKERLLSDAQK